MLGITIGVLLLVKLSILRWFRHFEEWMPTLGTALLLCTFLLTGLSLPFVAKERALVAGQVGGSAFSAANQERVAALLPGAGLPEGANLKELSSKASLENGREVLLGKCVYCHDLRTAIARPRTPTDWARTVKRMVDKPTLGKQITPDEANQVTAYLIAITPDLQNSAAAKRESDIKKSDAMEAAKKAMADEKPAPSADDEPPAADGDAAEPEKPAKTYDPAKAKAAYEEVCSQCHELSDVTEAPPATAKEVEEVVLRMVENGLEEEEEILAMVRWYLNETFAKSE